MPSSIFRDGLLDGQVVVITGGGTGIGAAIARELGHLGATVVIASRDAEHIEPAAAGLSEELGRPVDGRLLDIRNRDSVAAFVKGVLGDHGRVDHLVNNAGGQFFAPAEAISARGWDAVVETNLTGTWNLTRALADAWMLRHGGNVVNVTMLTRRTFAGMAHSHAARAGVEAMTRTLAIEWASRQIRLNCVAPGFVASSGIRTYPAGLGIIERIQQLVPMKRLATSEEVAWTVAYLCSPAGAYITGQVLTIDGGKDLWGDWWPIPDPKHLGPVVIPREPWEDPEEDG